MQELKPVFQVLPLTHYSTLYFKMIQFNKDSFIYKLKINYYSIANENRFNSRLKGKKLSGNRSTLI